MLARLVTISTAQSFFLFGARGTGKTSLVRAAFGIERGATDAWYIDLLNLELEAKYQLEPERLFKELSALPSTIGKRGRYCSVEKGYLNSKR